MKKVYTTFLFVAFVTLLLCAHKAAAQQDSAAVVAFGSENLQNPAFERKGYSSFDEWVDKHYEYPLQAAMDRVDGTSIVQFSIAKNGKVCDINILQSSGNKDLDREAIRVVKSSPKWAPGSINGEAVPVVHSVAVKFDLTGVVIHTTQKTIVQGKLGERPTTTKTSSTTYTVTRTK